MTAFSKGEWYIDSMGVLHLGDAFDRNIAVFISSEATKKSNDENARLIVAAPEMYDKLYDALQLMEGKSSYEGDVFDLQAKSIRELLNRIDGKADCINQNSL